MQSYNGGHGRAPPLHAFYLTSACFYTLFVWNGTTKRIGIIANSAGHAEFANLLYGKIVARAEARLFARVKEELVRIEGTVVHRFKNAFVVALDGDGPEVLATLAGRMQRRGPDVRARGVPVLIDGRVAQ